MDREQWPVFGQMTHKEKPDHQSELNFYVQSRDLYVDFPNQFIENAVSRIFGVQNEHPDDRDKQLESAKELATELTRSFRQIHEGINDEWLKIIVADTWDMWGYFAIRIRTDWDEFFNFLDNFATCEKELSRKYLYLRGSRGVEIELASNKSNPTERIDRIQDAVREFVDDELDRIGSEIEEFSGTLDEFKSDLSTFSRRKTVLDLPAVLRYMTEVRTILNTTETLVDEGKAPACFREFRKLLENLCWAMFHDLLVSNSDYYEYFKENRNVPGAPSPYQGLTQRWYEWDETNLRGWDDVKPDIHGIRDSIHSHLDDTGYEMHKGEMTVAIRDRMSYPLFVVLTGTPIAEDELDEVDFNQLGHPLPIEQYQPLVEHSLRSILKEVKGKRLYQKDKNFVENLAKQLTPTEDGDLLVPAFPSNAFVIDYVNRVFSESNRNLGDLYSEYSYFVHSYTGSWQVYPFSSVLEYKILEHEVNRFSEAVKEQMAEYIDHCY